MRELCIPTSPQPRPDAPLLVNGQVVGIVREHTDTHITALIWTRFANVETDSDGQLTAVELGKSTSEAWLDELKEKGIIE